MKTLTQGFSWKLSSQKPNESSQITGKSLTCGLVSIPWRKKKNNCMNIYQVELSHVLLEHVLLEQVIRRANTQRCRTGGNKCFSPSTKDSKTDKLMMYFVVSDQNWRSETIRKEQWQLSRSWVLQHSVSCCTNAGNTNCLRFQIVIKNIDFWLSKIFIYSPHWSHCMILSLPLLYLTYLQNVENKLPRLNPNVN